MFAGNHSGKGFILITMILVILAYGSAALAQEENKDKWEFTISPYMWLSGIQGTSATLPPLPPGNVNLKFGDILQDLDAAFMVAGEVRHGKWGGFGD